MLKDFQAMNKDWREPVLIGEEGWGVIWARNRDNQADLSCRQCNGG